MRLVSDLKEVKSEAESFAYRSVRPSIMQTACEIKSTNYANPTALFGPL
jgi:hypothetical protein